MKTITEFDGFLLRNAFAAKDALFKKKLAESKAAPSSDGKSDVPAEEKKTAPTEETPSSEEATTDVENSTSTETPVEASSEESTPVEEPAQESTPAVEESESKKEAAPQETASAEKKDQPSKQKGPHPKKPKKKKREPIVLDPAELSQAIAEKLGLEEGDRLSRISEAVQVIDHRRVEDLRRVVVSTLNEGEKEPTNARKMGDFYYTVEYLPSLKPPPKKKKRGKNGKRFSKGKKKGRGNRRPPKDGAGKPSAGKPRPPRRNAGTSPSTGAQKSTPAKTAGS